MFSLFCFLDQLENEKIVAQKERELELLRVKAEKESQEQHVSNSGNDASLSGNRNFVIVT